MSRAGNGRRPSMTISIELADRDHVPAIPAIELAAAAMFAEADLPLAVRYLVTEDELLHQAQRDARLWVALNGDRIPVGFAMAGIVDGGAHLDEMDVLPHYGRQGIGTRLMHAFIGWARSESYPVVTLVTFRHLPWNAPFYEKIGFVSMEAAEIGAELAALLAEEVDAGIDIRNRTCMKLVLSGVRH